MPNHITNYVRMVLTDENYEKGEQILAFVAGEKTPFDFNKFFPYPKEYELADKAAHEHEKKGGNWDDRPADGFNHGGYEWCITTWGTKWNAYSVKQLYDGWCFQTAWNCPMPILIALSEKFPDIDFIVAWADEGGGSEMFRLKNGEAQNIDAISVRSDLFEYLVKGLCEDSTDDKYKKIKSP
jgi:hypothetical protein